jgi:hypothetical protein
MVHNLGNVFKEDKFKKVLKKQQLLEVVAIAIIYVGVQSSAGEKIQTGKIDCYFRVGQDEAACL